MKPRIHRSPEVKNDLRQIAKYIGQPHSRRFLDAVEVAFRRLAELPYLGGEFESSHSRLAGLRVWPIPGFEDYLIFYRPIENGIVVAQVVHGARNLERILRN